MGECPLAVCLIVAWPGGYFMKKSDGPLQV